MRTIPLHGAAGLRAGLCSAPGDNLGQTTRNAHQLARVVLAQLAKDPRHVAVDAVDALLDLGLALVGEAHDHAAAVMGTGVPLHQAATLELVDRLGDARSRHLTRARQGSWGHALGLVVERM